jgi:curved DNA-binding protein CbpA
VLGVPSDASAAEISRAFRRKAFACHPDHGGDAAAFRELCRAREALLEPDRRTAYDRSRRVADPPPPADTGRPSGPEPAAADPFEWAAGAGPRTEDWSSDGTWSFRDPFPMYEAGYSWRRSDRFAWWKPVVVAKPRRRRGRS